MRWVELEGELDRMSKKAIAYKWNVIVLRGEGGMMILSKYARQLYLEGTLENRRLFSKLE